MEKPNKDVIQESAQVLTEKTDIPDGPNVGPSPMEHLAAQGIVQPPLHAGDLPRGDNAYGSGNVEEVDEATEPDDAIRKAQAERG